MNVPTSDTCNLNQLPAAKSFRRKRFSSYDRSGGNKDMLIVEPGTTVPIAETKAAGVIKHIWCTIGNPKNIRCEKNYLRKIVIRMFWDGTDTPSVEAPIGDFFGMGHGQRRNFVSAPLQMSPENGSSFNCWFPMPFSEGARIEITNECTHPIMYYYYVDWEEHNSIAEGQYRFHASWHRELTEGISDKGLKNFDFQLEGTNTTGEDNYTILEAAGQGHYVGCNLNIHNRRVSANWDWPGEGDDMIFVDGETWPPEIHGTGTEDYVNMAFCPTQEYNAPYHGLILGGGVNWSRKITYYRYHILDPIPFQESIRVTIEHGHANRRWDDWSSTAYWYQKGVGTIRRLPPVGGRIPLPDKFSFRRLLARLFLWPLFKIAFSL